jgi:hypothetical protein
MVACRLKRGYIGVAQQPAIVCRGLVAPVSLIARRCSAPRVQAMRSRQNIVNSAPPSSLTAGAPLAEAARRCAAATRDHSPGLRGVVSLIACRFSNSSAQAMRSRRNTMNSVPPSLLTAGAPLAETASRWALVGSCLNSVVATTRARPRRQTRIYRHVYVQRNKYTNTALSCE